MSALPRPDVTGPGRVLNDALHDLHHRAGWPSLRVLARETGVSHTTVSKVFSSAALPTWGTLELLVEALAGDTHDFHHLWLAASAPTSGDGPPAAHIAGRRTELDAVRRHLATGTGLLMVTGEAGMGKTTLVTAASHDSGAVVSVGRCLPLSTEVPLLPIADALRSLVDGVGGGRLLPALAQCPAYVASSLSRLLPEIAAVATVPDPDDAWSRQRLFQAVGSDRCRDGRKTARSPCSSRTSTGPTPRLSICWSTCWPEGRALHSSAPGGSTTPTPLWHIGSGSTASNAREP